MTASLERVLAAVLVGLGLALVVSGWLLRIQRRQQSLAELLGLDGGEGDVPVEVVTESPEAPPVSRLTARLGELVGRVDTRGSLTRSLKRAEIPMKAGEYLVLVGSTAILLSLILAFVVGKPLLGVLCLVVVAGLARAYPSHVANNRRESIRRQLPHAFSLIASSVSSGHTFLRSIQMLSGEIPPPLAGELQQVTTEVTLGSNLIDALDHFAQRVEIAELRWAVKAVRIQQTTGGQLGEILHTLAEFMRAREDVHREVKVLTAEGKFSGYVLMALPVVVLAALLLLNPGYLHPMFQGWGWFFTGLAASMLLIGAVIIRRLVQIEV